MPLPVDMVLPATANWSQAVNFVEKDDGGSHQVSLKRRPMFVDEEPVSHPMELSFSGPVTCSNSRRSCRSDSPTHLLRQSAPFLMKKDTFLSP